MQYKTKKGKYGTLYAYAFFYAEQYDRTEIMCDIGYQYDDIDDLLIAQEELDPVYTAQGFDLLYWQKLPLDPMRARSMVARIKSELTDPSIVAY